MLAQSTAEAILQKNGCKEKMNRKQRMGDHGVFYWKRDFLFYGTPGTGETLVACVVANECSQGDGGVIFFMRNGVNCLSEWAYQIRPSVFFLDEIDALAPICNNKQDQVYRCVVGTLLALMDGFTGGKVVIIRAISRLESIDPALQRPGHFVLEFPFNLPNKEVRTLTQWL